MALYAPIYRAEFYQPRTVDPTESAILTPPVGAPHSDPLRVATRQGVNVLGNDYKPYLISVSGRRGRLDPLRKRMDSGSITLSIGDVRTTPGTGSNAQRWLTAFTNVAKGAKVRVWESLDLGATWSVWWTGRVIAMRTTSRVVWEVTVEDMGADLKGIVFARRPHGSVSGYADVITHVPNSIPASNANERVNAIGLPVVPRPRATVNNASEGASYRSLSIKTESTYTTTVIWPDAINRATIEQLNAPNPNGAGPTVIIRRARWTDNTVIRLRTEAGNEYAVEYVDFTYLSQRGYIALRALISQLPGGPALPTAGATIGISLVEPGAQVSEEVPLYIGAVNPITLLKDLLDGDFGILTPGGAQSNPVPYDATSVNALEAKLWVPHSYWITEAEERSGFIEKNICEVCNVAWRVGPDGVVYLADLNTPTSVAGLPLIEGTDLLDPSDPPMWEETTEDTFPLLEVEFPVATFTPPANGQPVQRGNFEMTEDRHAFGFITQSEINYTIQKHSINARGWLVGYDLSLPVADQNGDVLNRLKRTAEEGEKLANALKYLFGGGPARVNVTLRRLSKYDAIWPGSFVRYNLDEVPNKASHVRGGERVGLVLERSEEGLGMELLIHDCGSSANASTPGITNPVASVLGYGVTTTVTLNGAGNPVEVEVAVADSAVGTAPVADSPLWRHAATANATGALTVGGLRLFGNNRRVWLRARSFAGGAGAAGILPSAWVVTSSVTLTAVPSPSGLSVNGIGRNKAVVNWTPGDTTLATDVYLFQGGADPTWGTVHFVGRVPPGSTSYELRGLDGPTVQYRVALCHVGPYDSRGNVVSTGFTTNSTVTAAPRPAGLDLALAGAGTPAY